MKKPAQKATSERVIGLAWWYGNPQPSYSAADIVRIFEPSWPADLVLTRIRNAIRTGTLRPYRVGVTNRFERSQVARFLALYRPCPAGVRANEAILSRFADLCIPTAELLEMLLAARDGQWIPPYEVTAGDKGDGAGPSDECPWPRQIGDVRNPDYPAANTDHFMKTPAYLSDEVPGLRTRIKADSERAKHRHARRTRKAGAQDDSSEPEEKSEA